MSNGFLPAWAEAKEMWPGVCQSCVSTTCAKRLASALIGANDLVAVLHGERAAGQEVVLHVDDDEDVVVSRLDRRRLSSRRGRRCGRRDSKNAGRGRLERFPPRQRTLLVRHGALPWLFPCGRASLRLFGAAAKRFMGRPSAPNLKPASGSSGSRA